MPRERTAAADREERGNERRWRRRRRRKEHLSLLWKSIEESSESASPGQRLCHLIGYVEQFILFFPIPRAEGEHRARERERRRVRTEREEVRDTEGEAEHTLLHLPATLRTRRRHFPISRQASTPVLLHPPPVRPPPPLFSLSSRLAPSLFSPRERENGSEARNEKKGRKESRWAAWEEAEEKVERTRARSHTASFGCNEKTE